MFWLGYDIGSSSIKAALIRATDGSVLDISQHPKKEMPMISLKQGWAEQDPELWWKYVCSATKELMANNKVARQDIKGIGISYQMHGLVTVNQKLKPIRPSIIWCDSRAVEIGEKLFQSLGKEKCVHHLLNSPSNFTLSKLKWVKDNEPNLYNSIYKFMLPGEYIAMKLTSECITTPSGLSEGIMWDFKEDCLADWLLEDAGIDPVLVSDVRPSFSEQGRVTKQGALETGLPEGIPIMYRAGDQPNNALSLGVMEPGQIAATGGTSGVVYAISDKITTKEHTRINSFAHTNHTATHPRIGKLLCINGTGIQYSWIKNELTDGLTYTDMNQMAASVPVGSEGLRIIPFGNGAERMLENHYTGAQVTHLNFNVHKTAHLFRAALEGIAFSFVYGMEILKNEGVDINSIKAGNDNLFRAEIFANTISTLTSCQVDIVETTGAVGAARAAAYASGEFNSIQEAMASDQVQFTYGPDIDKPKFQEAYNSWKKELETYIDN